LHDTSGAGVLTPTETHEDEVCRHGSSRGGSYCGRRPHDALQTLDDAGLVFYVGTFTKSLLPSLRIGFVVSPPWATEALIAAKRLEDGQCAAILHNTLSDFINEGHLARCVRKMRNVYSARNDLVNELLTSQLPHLLGPIRSSAGIHCSAYFRDDVDLMEVMARVTKAGLAIEDLDRFWIASPKRSGLAFGYSAMDEKHIAEGINALAVSLGDL
jgi:GntR family transcriptional regulator/MocR family aminotransferase